jgi:hypothetical protein
VPEPYLSPDWALIPAKQAQRLNTTTTTTTNINNNNNNNNNFSIALIHTIFIRIYQCVYTQGNSYVPPEIPNSPAQQPRQIQQNGAYQEVENISRFFVY